MYTKADRDEYAARRKRVLELVSQHPRGDALLADGLDRSPQLLAYFEPGLLRWGRERGLVKESQELRLVSGNDEIQDPSQGGVHVLT